MTQFIATESVKVTYYYYYYKDPSLDTVVLHAQVVEIATPSVDGLLTQGWP